MKVINIHVIVIYFVLIIEITMGNEKNKLDNIILIVGIVNLMY